MPERLLGHVWEIVETLGPIVRAAVSHRGLHPRLEGSRSSRVVATEAAPDDADPAGIDVISGDQPIDGGRHGHFVVGSDG